MKGGETEKGKKRNRFRFYHFRIYCRKIFSLSDISYFIETVCQHLIRCGGSVGEGIIFSKFLSIRYFFKIIVGWVQARMVLVVFMNDFMIPFFRRVSEIINK